MRLSEFGRLLPQAVLAGALTFGSGCSSREKAPSQPIRDQYTYTLVDQTGKKEGEFDVERLQIPKGESATIVKFEDGSALVATNSSDTNPHFYVEPLKALAQDCGIGNGAGIPIVRIEVTDEKYFDNNGNRTVTSQRNEGSMRTIMVSVPNAVTEALSRKVSNNDVPERINARLTSAVVYEMCSIGRGIPNVDSEQVEEAIKNHLIPPGINVQKPRLPRS